MCLLDLGKKLLLCSELAASSHMHGNAVSQQLNGLSTVASVLLLPVFRSATPPLLPTLC